MPGHRSINGGEKVPMGSDSISHTVPKTPPYQLQRRGVVLRPDPANPYEQGGVLNPAAVSRNGLTYLLYRAVATTPHNYSRILLATCTDMRPIGPGPSTTTVSPGRIRLFTVRA